MRSIHTCATLLILIMACIVSPALADVKYTGGSPNLSAYVSGLNEFTAGSDITIPVVISELRSQSVPRKYRQYHCPRRSPQHRKVRHGKMSAADAPVVIKSDPQMIGDIPGQTTETVVFSATVNADAPAGTYLLPIDISYSTLSSVDEYTAQPMFQNYYQQHNVTLTCAPGHKSGSNSPGNLGYPVQPGSRCRRVCQPHAEKYRIAGRVKGYSQTSTGWPQPHRPGRQWCLHRRFPRWQYRDMPLQSVC